MNLALDFGNTRIKAGLFDKDRILQSEIFYSAEELLGSQIVKKANQCIVCSVTEMHGQAMTLLKDSMKVHLFMPTTPVPLKNRYSSALTLGSDRLAAAVGGFALYPGRNVLTIDAGTCIKYNFVNDLNEYLGGAISPGIPMRLKAMNQFTSRLPLVDLVSHSKLVGSNTAESLLTGAVVASACEIDGMISRYNEAYKDVVVILTGGDATYLSGQLKNSFFAHQNLLLQGLNTILEFNAGK